MKMTIYVIFLKVIILAQVFVIYGAWKLHGDLEIACEKYKKANAINEETIKTYERTIEQYDRVLEVLAR